jgi:hypothetical protein
VRPGHAEFPSSFSDHLLGAGVSIEEPRGRCSSVEELAALTKARSLLLLLLATCKETLLALEAAANTLDTDLTSDLRAMIERSEAELAALNAKIAALPAS